MLPVQHNDDLAERPLKICFVGLALTSAWGNGHATTYRGLLKALYARGHAITFCEQYRSYYAAHQDLPEPAFCTLHRYEDVSALEAILEPELSSYDAVIIGSYVADAPELLTWLQGRFDGPLAFYDIDTPITLEALEQDTCSYITRSTAQRIDLYLSFSGGLALKQLEDALGVARARHLPCSVDPDVYSPIDCAQRYRMGYLGTYSEDRQPTLQSFLLDPARQLPEVRFVVAGPQYPASIAWPENVERIEHLPPSEHTAFYAAQAMTLNVTRAAMRRLGHSPSVRLFEAAACGVAILSDTWPGIEDYFEPGTEIRLAETPEAALAVVKDESDDALNAIGAAARRRVLREHTPLHRARALEGFLAGVL